MSSDPPRRVATVPLSVPQNHQTPPPAPPLPPQQRARNALNRFLGFPARASDSDDDGQGTRYLAEANRATAGRLPSLSAHDASASHKTGLEINSLSINDEGTHALLAGREIFKTIRVEEGTCTEDINLRTAIRSYDAHLATGGLAKDAVNIHDVAWGKGNYGNFIAAATYNGPIIIYDLTHPGIEVARLHEHRRQVHRVTFNPHAGQHFLSGSQDGTVRLWDLRDLRRDSSSFASRFTTTGQNEGVRDVKWSPTDVFALALCTDGGVVQRWDTRKLKSPLAKIAAHTRIAAHTSPCATIDWHPDGKHVLSASADKTVKVWNLSAESGRRLKPAHEIKAPYPIRNARWRPSCQSVLPKDRGARLCSQIVTSYERDFDVMHIWDFRRPWLPFREVTGYCSAPADLLWHSQDLLWTVGKEGMFIQHDVKYANKVLDNRNMQALAISPLGEFNVATQRRPPQPRPGLSANDSDQFLAQKHRDTDEKKNSQQLTGRGSADDSVEETFLSTSFGKKYGRRGSTSKGSRLATEPPTSAPVENPPPQSLKTMGFEDTLTKKRIFHPSQGSAAGALPGTPDAFLLAYFAQKYKTRPLGEPPSVENYLRVQEVFEVNAAAAQQASMYRMSQAWRVVGQATTTELRRRAVAHREFRVKGNPPKKGLFDESPFAKRARKWLASGRRLSSKPATPLVKPVKALEAAHVAHFESTSNVATPIAKPQTEHIISPRGRNHTQLQTISQDDEGLALPPSLLSPSRLKQQVMDREHRVSRQDGGKESPWYQSAEALGERKAELSGYRVQSKEPLSLEPPQSRNGMDVWQKPQRHYSDDSLVLLPSVSSRDASLPVSSVASMTSLMDTVHENLMGPSPQGSMNIGSSSSSEPNLTQETFPRSFYSYPSQMVPRKAATTETVISSSAESHSDVAAADKEADQEVHAQPTDIPPVRDIVGDVKALALNNQLSFSSDSEITSSSEGQKASKGVLPETIPEDILTENMEASGTIVPPLVHIQNRLPRSREGSRASNQPFLSTHKADNAPTALPHKSNHHTDMVPFVPADFVGTDFHVDTEQHTPFPLIALLQQLLEYHTRTVPDAQAAAHFLLLLTPLLPQTHQLTASQIDSTITVYSEHFAALGYTDEEIYSLLQNSFESLIKAGLQPLWAESIMMTYHDQLQRLGLFNNAAYLRRLAYPTYPGVYEQGLKDNAMSFLCGECKKPINNGTNKFRCENCETRQKACPICLCVTSPFEAPAKHIHGSKGSKAQAVEHHDVTETQQEGSGIVQLEDQNSVASFVDDIWDRREHQEHRQEAARIGAIGATPLEPTTSSTEDTTVAAYPPTDLHKPLLYSTCLLCNHTAHTACLRVWHSPDTTASSAESEAENNDDDDVDENVPPPFAPQHPDPQSEGLCPTQSCLCACTPGRARSAALAYLEASESERRNATSSAQQRASISQSHNQQQQQQQQQPHTPRIKEDDWVAGESRAVRETSAALGGQQAPSPRIAGLNSSGSNSNHLGTGTDGGLDRLPSPALKPRSQQGQGQGSSKSSQQAGGGGGGVAPPSSGRRRGGGATGSGNRETTASPSLLPRQQQMHIQRQQSDERQGAQQQQQQQQQERLSVPPHNTRKSSSGSGIGAPATGVALRAGSGTHSPGSASGGGRQNNKRKGKGGR
ncbi:hypothetical protein AAFC00_000490 [Neodothiora populina]|uniref:WD repeat protein n=1 Tax=Neodothiora populina TaxID=2781224 RepID=A0ABR3PD25_9PEZI